MAVANFATEPTRLNSDVTVVAYPLSSLLGGVNVSRGAVSSLKGFQGDSARMPITAPVQLGNSGGPVLSADGAVVGIVVSKLLAAALGPSGDALQNVNFAIRDRNAKLFLTSNGVEPVLAGPDPVLAPELLAEQATRFTVFIQCN